MAEPERRGGPDRRGEILDAALKVFSERGYGGASMRGIAREAGITQPLIYWYFEGKEGLFGAMLSELSPLFRWAEDPEGFVDLPPEEALSKVARAELDSFADPEVVRLLRIVFAESATSPGDSGSSFLAESQKGVIRFLVAYLERQVELGTLEEHDVESAARSFFGSLVFYVLSRAIFPHLAEGFPDKERYVQSVVGVFLDGLRAGRPGEESR